MERVHMRLAKPADAGAIAAIYRPYVAGTAISLETVPLTAEEMARRMAAIGETYPYLVCTAGERVVGYAYAGRHMERAAFDWNATVSVYIHEDFHGRGMGRAMYTALEELLRRMGVVNLYALVLHPNPPSQRLHEGMGYTQVGILHNTGYKLGQWRDVVYYVKPIAPHDAPTGPVKPVHELGERYIREVLDRAADGIRR